MTDEPKIRERLRYHLRVYEGKIKATTSAQKKLLQLRKAARELATLTGEPILSLIPVSAYNKKETAELTKPAPRPKLTRSERDKARNLRLRERMTEEQYVQYREEQREKRATLARTRAQRESEKLERQAEHLKLQQDREERAVQRNLELETQLAMLIVSQRTVKYSNREAWLTAFVDGSKLIFEMNDYSLPDNIKISVGFPHVGARGRRVGECWSEEKAGEYQLFISPLLDDPHEVCAAVTHELAHAAVGLKQKHNKTFTKCAYKLGLEGKPKTTTHGDLWQDMHGELIQSLGAFPHRKLTVITNAKKDTTRNLLIECPECGCKFRMARKWIEDTTEVQCPLISCGNTIPIDAPEAPDSEEDDDAGTEEPPLFAVSK